MTTIRRAVSADLPELVSIDADSVALYFLAGVRMDVADDHPFVVEEQARWARSLQAGHGFVALEGERPVGFAVCGFVDGEPYLDQLSTHTAFMRRGIGRSLLLQTIAWAEPHGQSLWLTTYAHLPWNRPFYESAGFRLVPEASCGPDILHHLDAQRACLPDPFQRIAMRRSLVRSSEIASSGTSVQH